MLNSLIHPFISMLFSIFSPAFLKNVSQNTLRNSLQSSEWSNPRVISFNSSLKSLFEMILLVLWYEFPHWIDNFWNCEVNWLKFNELESLDCVWCLSVNGFLFYQWCAGYFFSVITFNGISSICIWSKDSEHYKTWS